MAENLIGKKFGRWTVIDSAEPKIYRGRKIRYWLCECECGTQKTVLEKSLLNGISKSCGCYHSDVMKSQKGKMNVTHGMSDKRLYRIFKHMHNRCYRESDIRYPRYGGRGIIVCEEWQEFEPFMEWALNNGYTDELTIDRIDKDGNYEPSNCRWVDNKTQCNNRSTNILVTYNDETHTIAEWAEIVDMPYKKLWKRIHNGWSPERALTT